jgi:hypothetical protein
MAHCDYLIGPPSTFTLWASFAGGAKYFHIESGGRGIDLRDFARCEW